MCKRNSPIKKKQVRSVEERFPIFLFYFFNPAWDVEENLPKKNKVSMGYGIRKRNPPLPPTQQQQHGMCKRNSPDKNEASTGCVRETPEIKMKPARNV